MVRCVVRDVEKKHIRFFVYVWLVEKDDVNKAHSRTYLTNITNDMLVNILRNEEFKIIHELLMLVIFNHPNDLWILEKHVEFMSNSK